VTTFVALLFANRGWANGWLAYTAYAAAFILARIFFSHVADAIGGAKVALVCALIEGLGQALIWLAVRPEMALAGAALTGFGFSLVYPGFAAFFTHQHSRVAPRLGARPQAEQARRRATARAQPFQMGGRAGREQEGGTEVLAVGEMVMGFSATIARSRTNSHPRRKSPATVRCWPGGPKRILRVIEEASGSVQMQASFAALRDRQILQSSSGARRPDPCSP